MDVQRLYQRRLNKYIFRHFNKRTDPQRLLQNVRENRFYVLNL